MAEALRPSETFRQRLEEARKRAGMTQADLARACAEVGEPSYRQTTIAKIENGDRGVAVDDVFVLAHALGISPAWLVTPTEAGTGVMVATDAIYDARAVRAWLRGHGSIAELDERRLLVEMPEEEWLVHQRTGLSLLRLTVQELIDAAVAQDDESLSRAVDALGRELERQRDDLEARQRGLGDADDRGRGRTG